MTPLQWFLLCVLSTLYLLFGGSVFMYFEQHHEMEKKEEISVLRKDIKEILILLDRDFYHNDTTKDMIHALTAAKLSVIHRISTACENVGELLPADSVDDSETTSDIKSTTASPTMQDDNGGNTLKWNFYNSVFFAFTVITTIGYGHLSPQTNWSKGFVMVYALIGIPINSILLSGLGDYFSSKLIKLHKKAKDKPEKKLTFILEIMFYLIPGIVIFIILPSGLFVLIEKWTFLDSIYFAFVSLTTIGFGDYVAGMGGGHTAWMWIYKSFIIIWITFGLGYLIMILGFISKGMTHKRVRVVIEKRLNTIRYTKDKLTRDIDYMRRVVNELYLMKIKPIYDDDSEDDEDFKTRTKRTQSQPCIRLDRRHSSFPHLPSIGLSTVDEGDEGNNNERKVKFNVEDGQCRQPSLKRRSSDTDLSHIDRDKTFEAALKNQVMIDELLITVVNALSGNVMHDVMEAVEELNDYEQEVIEEGEMKNIAVGTPTSQKKKSKDHGNDYVRRDQDELPPWDLGALSESDEEVLIEEDEDDTDSLRQVVVHKDDNNVKPSTSSTLLDKVSGAIRKISTGSRTSEISRSDSVRRRISRNDSFDRRYGLVHHSHSRPYLNPQAYASERKLSHQRKISEESRISNCSIRSRLTEASNAHGYGSNSRRVSPVLFYQEDSADERERENVRSSKLSLESTSLAEFLHALDHVHSKLTSNRTSAVSMSQESLYDPYPYDGVGGSLHSRYPPGGRLGRRVSQDNAGAPTFPRRRKNGVIHPQFAYVNDSFVPDNERDRQRRKSHMKEPPHPKK